jgi:ribosomal protein S18 acetylase RimI-like enzyme
LKNYITTILTLVLIVLVQSNAYAMHENAEIVPFQEERDFPAIQKILNDYPGELRYESLGYAAGTTEKYIKSPKYKTDVLRVDDTTVGFVNYAADNFTLLTFHLNRYGVLHLLGVDKDHQKQGFGKLLVRHAVKELEKLKAPNLSLTVKRDNIAARTLYEKEGFATRFADLSHLPPELQAKFATLPMPYTKNLDIPADELPKGNIIQQYPGTSLAIGAASLGALAYYKYRK